MTDMRDNYAAWRIHNPTKKHVDYLRELDRGWRIFNQNYNLEQLTIEEAREAFTVWHLHNHMAMSQGFIPH